MELFWKYPRFFRPLYNDLRAMVPNSRADFVPLVLERYAAFPGQMEQLCADGIAVGQFRSVDPSIWSMVFEATIGGYLERMTRSESPSRPHHKESQLLEFFLSGAVRRRGDEELGSVATARQSHAQKSGSMESHRNGNSQQFGD